VKKFFSITLVILILSALPLTTALTTPIGSITFPDPYFEAAVRSEIGVPIETDESSLWRFVFDPQNTDPHTTQPPIFAAPTVSTVLVNGIRTEFEAYNIGGNNFFKLRDIAYILSKTEKQFDVGYDNNTKVITLTSSIPYTVVGGEMTLGDGGDKTATPTISNIYLDGKGLQFIAYNIGGNNYFKMRDIGEAFDFGVDWDGANNTIMIDTSKEYSIDGETTIPLSRQYNPLTGLPSEIDISNNRPLAIMINNNYEAMPQIGVSNADIIYETLIEGGLTRMLAIYQDISDAGVIGSIRSTRHYFVDLASSYDAILIFAGASPQAYSTIKDRDITYLDAVLGSSLDIFYRDPARLQTMNTVDSLVTSSDLIEKWLPQYGFRLQHDEGYKQTLRFIDDGTPVTEAAATIFTVSYEASKPTSFSYNSSDNMYYLSQHGSRYIDGNDNKQLAFTNVLVLKTPVSFIVGDYEGRRDIVTTGDGVGYYICGGKYIGIKWSRPDYSSQFEYTLDDGSELFLGRGKTYICIVPDTGDIVFE